MRVKYVQMEAHEADPENFDADDCPTAVVRIVDEKIDAIVGVDGGEPEDNRLYRDWAWVTPALNDAYRRGLEDGSAVVRSAASTVAGTLKKRKEKNDAG
jgi:hypothetical protein